MSDYVSASAIKDLLTECPICTEHFDEARRTPRRMPCCVQSICQACLETHSKGLPKLTCPMCRHQHNLPGGVKSLPKEPIILRILDHLKIVKGLHLPCTHCPDGNPAMSRCDDCGVFLCQECLNAHKRVKLMRDHQPVSFKEMKKQPGKSFNRHHKCAQHDQPLQFYCYTCEKIVCVSCTVVDHKEGNGHNVVSVNEAHRKKAKSIDDTLVKLRQKAEELERIKQGLKERHSNIQVSKQAAVVDINKAFDELIDEIQQRRGILLSDIEKRSSKILKLTQEELDSTRNILAKVTSSTKYTRQMRSKADMIEDLQMMGSSAATLSAMLEMSPKASLGRAGVSFASTCFSKITPLLKMAGLVKSVVFSQTETPNGNKSLKDAMTIEHEQVPQAAYMTGQPLGVKGSLACADLEWDSSIASDGLTVSGPVVTNGKQEHLPPRTGCRLLSSNRLLTSTPLVIRPGQTIMYGMEVTYSVITPYDNNTFIFEAALTGNPVDAYKQQTTGLSVFFATCPAHNGICLQVHYNGQRLTDDNLTLNESSATYSLDLGFVLEEETHTVHVLDLSQQKLVTSVTTFPFDKPLWVMTLFAPYPNTHLTCELSSQKGINMHDAMKRLIHE
ncbi:tripartite motif-containing protein 45-like [Haliotis rufescens]|uniref:tripartite motif-containing protein 45-like n=1 Tax=Haliotis rufescens TaxID=6454 RepID=UPI00201EF15C|nr:tripartite motif-containing protein 45-like [Haliotis rufescens]